MVPPLSLLDPTKSQETAALEIQLCIPAAEQVLVPDGLLSYSYNTYRNRVEDWTLQELLEARTWNDLRIAADRLRCIAKALENTADLNEMFSRDDRERRTWHL